MPHAVSCRALGVSQSFFYKWRNRSRSDRERRRHFLRYQICVEFAGSGGTYGSPRIRDSLAAKGWRVSKNTVAEQMAQMGLVARPKHHRKSDTEQAKGCTWRAPDLVHRAFKVDQLDALWVGDGKTIHTGEGHLYLDTVEDMCSRRLIGFALGEHHDAELATAALQMALRRWGRPWRQRRRGRIP